jgi:hypothetical protein
MSVIPFSSTRLVAPAALILASLVAMPARGQEWVRQRMVQPDSISGNTGSRGGESARIGAIQGSLSLFAELRFNDNIRLEDSGAKSGTSLQLGGRVGLNYPISDMNELTLEASVAQEFFLGSVSGEKSFRTIEPGSTLGMNVIVGRAKIHPFITAQLQEDPITAPVLDNTARYGRLNVDGGVQVDWDMNRVIWQGSAVYGRQEEISGGNGSLNAWRRALSLRPLFPLGPGQAWGLAVSYSENDYDRSIQNDSTTFTYGGLLALSVGKNKRMQASAGISNTNYDTRGSINDFEDRNDFYAQVQFDHQMRRSLRYTILLRHDGYEGFGTNFYQITSIGITPQMNVFSRGELSTGLTYEWIDESGPKGETAERIGLNVALKMPLGRRFDGTVSWQYFSKDSDVAGRGYGRQLWALRLNYTP